MIDRYPDAGDAHATALADSPWVKLVAADSLRGPAADSPDAQRRVDALCADVISGVEFDLAVKYHVPGREQEAGGYRRLWDRQSQTRRMLLPATPLIHMHFLTGRVSVNGRLPSTFFMRRD